jgi:small-conductance mechanosensitive channel
MGRSLGGKPKASIFTFCSSLLDPTCDNRSMATTPVAPKPEGKFFPARIFGRVRLIVLLALAALLILCMVFVWTTRDAMEHLRFIRTPGTSSAIRGTRRTIVDLSPWQTAEALASLAVTTEEKGYAQEAQRLADHEVDQAFASALRLAILQAQRRTLTGDALALSKKVDQLQQVVNQDQAVVRQLSSSASGSKDDANAGSGNDDLDIAKAQLGLDSDELANAQEDLERASGDQRTQIQSELAAHEAAMKKYDSESHLPGEIAMVSVARNSTVAGRIKAWNKQRDRYALIVQALQQAQADIRDLTTEHTALEAKTNANAAADATASDRTTKLAGIKDRSAEHQLLSIYDDRIQTEQQLATVYGKWSVQVLLQHRILMHLILQSAVLIVIILICMVLGDALVRRLATHPALDRRQSQTLRTILVLAIQVLGAVFILLVIFGAPRETPTILGLATAALTIALQDFILAFLGWFVLMGKKGLRVGDWVQINGVEGEVTELGLFSTTLLETGTDKGYPTGRRISFINSYAIRGQYFNFSTTGQWMWDEITVALPASNDTHTMVERILKAVTEETEQNARIAEQEWKRGMRGDSLSKFRAAPSVNLRPSGSGIDLEVRYVTRASDRFEIRNRLYRHVIDLLHEPKNSDPGPEPPGQ